MNVALTNHYEALIGRLVGSGRYHDASEVVRAGLRRLEDDELAKSPLLTAPICPEGSLLAQYQAEDNDGELRLLRGCTTKVEGF